jgi:hypothetical protein
MKVQSRFALLTRSAGGQILGYITILSSALILLIFEWKEVRQLNYLVFEGFLKTAHTPTAHPFLANIQDSTGYSDSDIKIFWTINKPNNT